MSSLSLAARNSSTMLRRNLLHAARDPHPEPAAPPIMLLLLFVYIFGDVMSARHRRRSCGRSDDYRHLVLPGLQPGHRQPTTIGTAVSVSNDMTEGIARFRTMAIHRGSVIIGHVIGSVLQSTTSVVLVGAVAVAIGAGRDATAHKVARGVRAAHAVRLASPASRSAWASMTSARPPAATPCR